jgi:hypothetical protein
MRAKTETKAKEERNLRLLAVQAPHTKKKIEGLLK